MSSAHETSARVASSLDGTTRKLDRLENLFERFAVVMQRRFRQRASEIDRALAPAGYRTLKTLARLGPTNQSSLIETLSLDKSALSRHLHQLAELGLVARVPDPSDGRAAVVSVTPAAHARLDESRNAARDSFRTRLAAWDPADLDDLLRLLALLWGAYEAE
jgi:DNA-binding MarR family transcriptional regulator